MRKTYIIIAELAAAGITPDELMGRLGWDSLELAAFLNGNCIIDNALAEKLATLAHTKEWWLALEQDEIDCQPNYELINEVLSILLLRMTDTAKLYREKAELLMGINDKLQASLSGFVSVAEKYVEKLECRIAVKQPEPVKTEKRKGGSFWKLLRLFR